MDKKLFVANWKSNKTTKETLEWLSELSLQRERIDFNKIEIVLCPSFICLSAARAYIQENNIPVFLGAQNISPFEQGAYTGEIAASQVKELAEYVIVGHSERAKYFHETRDDVGKKIELVRKVGLQSFLCIPDEPSYQGEDVDHVVYEPPTAISTFEGKVEDALRVTQVFDQLSQRTSAQLLYGGSVNPDTISRFASIQKLRGFLVGAASLEVGTFVSLLTSW